MQFNVIILPQAKLDITRNGRWWAEHHSEHQAEKWVATVEQQLRSLTSMPSRFGVANENAQFPYEIRSMLVGLGSPPSYRAVYHIRDSSVFVVAVRRGAEAPLDPLDFPLGHRS